MDAFMLLGLFCLVGAQIYLIRSHLDIEFLGIAALSAYGVVSQWIYPTRLLKRAFESRLEGSLSLLVGVWFVGAHVVTKGAEVPWLSIAFAASFLAFVHLFRSQLSVWTSMSEKAESRLEALLFVGAVMTVLWIGKDRDLTLLALGVLTLRVLFYSWPQKIRTVESPKVSEPLRKLTSSDHLEILLQEAQQQMDEVKARNKESQLQEQRLTEREVSGHWPIKNDYDLNKKPFRFSIH